ncbi:MAG: terpene cyclase/mutase family protein [Acidimicrobiia bacterium]|nr:terpene cyclase/mutase family protein [Acidimicrobiia bacterium]
MQSLRRGVFTTLLIAVAISGCKYTGFAVAANTPVLTKAHNWLVTHQQADGSFEVSGFAGFETPDAVVALAEHGQTTLTWDSTAARNAVAAVKKNNKSALDALDDFADGSLSAGQAAKLIVLVAKPLGISPTAFDPQSDGARNLVAAVDAGAAADGSYGAFNATLYAALAKQQTAGAVPAKTLAVIRAAQQANGGWNYSGDHSGTDIDVDSTALAVQALVAGKATPTDPNLVKALQFLADTQTAGGAWPSFGSDDPNSTSTAILAVTAAGFDVTASCWRDTVRPARTGTAYASPVTWLRNQQAADGHIISANDAFPPVNTFATTQTVQALARGWLPVAWLAPRSC